jgi:UDP-GlcNAc:undecaprenyl-phosphate/decaprenyl-phosphate GlcNAc-1-phosphate transferase
LNLQLVRSLWFEVFLAPAGSGIALLLLLWAGPRLPHATPNDRSLHQRPIPRVGGLAIWAGWLPVMLLVAGGGGDLWIWCVPWLALTLVSLRDDARSVPIGVRLAVHVLAALWVAAALALRVEATGTWSLPVIALGAVGAALIVAWSLNLFNFMDGSDGLAAVMTIVGFGAYGLGALRVDAPAAGFFALAAATLPVLAANFPPARIFLGDVGAVPLGFLAATFGLAGVAAGTWPPWFPALVFLPFIADATVTLACRSWRREKVWEAHRAHYYQRLLLLGAGHGGTLAVYSVWMLGTTGSALICLCHAPGWGAPTFLAWCAAAAVFFAAIDYHWGRQTKISR